MISEIIPKAYDIEGRKIAKPSKKIFRPTFPMGRFLSQPLNTQYSSIDEIRQFLCTCKYVSDQEQFNKSDYWLPPEEFEERRKGDCEDFALWTWRQVIGLGLSSRFVVGTSGRYGEGHAWLTIIQNGKQCLLEPLACHAGLKLPRLSMLRYDPKFSVEWDGKNVHYSSHNKLEYNPSFGEVLPLFGEWLLLWAKMWTKYILRLFLLPFKWLHYGLKKLSKKLLVTNHAV